MGERREREQGIEEKVKTLRIEQEALLREYNEVEEPDIAIPRKKELAQRYAQIDGIIETLLFGEMVQ